MKGIWVEITSELVDSLVDFIGDRRVLEVFAGWGDLGLALSQRGVHVKSTSVHMSCYDGEASQMPAHVESLDAVSACMKYCDDYDVLLAAWPIADDTLLHCALEWNKPIICIGELWHKHPLSVCGHYSGTASDAYFENVVDIAPPKRVLSNIHAAVMFHELKEELVSGFRPYLLMSGFGDSRALLKRYNERVG